MFFTYTPTAAGDLTDSFTVTVSDGFGGSTDVKIDIEIS
jgi:VCBS repeat-containing protein